MMPRAETWPYAASEPEPPTEPYPSEEDIEYQYLKCCPVIVPLPELTEDPYPLEVK